MHAFFASHFTIQIVENFLRPDNLGCTVCDSWMLAGATVAGARAPPARLTGLQHAKHSKTSFETLMLVEANEK